MKPQKRARAARAWGAIAVFGALACVAMPRAGGAGAVTSPPRLLDDFREPALWVAKPSSGVALTLAGDRGEGGEGGERGERALRLDFDFAGRGGWAAAVRPLDLALPENWELRFRLRGEAPVNNLEMKLVDSSGENVWWMVRRDYAAPREWTTLRVYATLRRERAASP